MGKTLDQSRQLLGNLWDILCISSADRDHWLAFLFVCLWFPSWVTVLVSALSPVLKGVKVVHCLSQSWCWQDCFKCPLWRQCWLWFCHKKPLSHWDIFPPALHSSALYHEVVLDFVRGSLCICWYDHVILSLKSSYMIYYMYWHMLSPSCITGINANLLLVDGLFVVCLSSVCKCFIEDFTCVFLRDMGLRFSFRCCVFTVLVLEWYHFLGEVWKCSFCFCSGILFPTSHSQTLPDLKIGACVL